MELQQAERQDRLWAPCRSSIGPDRFLDCRRGPTASGDRPRFFVGDFSRKLAFVLAFWLRDSGVLVGLDCFRRCARVLLGPSFKDLGRGLSLTL
jgi:hypothetical protein